jgi:uncharacterized iron-regulated membrane protein
MRLPLRKVLFWLHLGAALMAGAVILLMAATGLLLAYEAQITAWADRAGRRVEPPPAPEAAPLPLERLLDAVAAERGDLPVTSITVPREPTDAVTLALGRTGVVYVDPYRGRVVGTGSTSVRRAMRAITDLHRYLGAVGEKRPLGKGVTGAVNLVFLFILGSGLYLWVPRVFNRTQVGNALWFRRGLAAKARDLNWHQVLGIWALVPLALMVVSAVPMSYRWAGDLLLWATGSPPLPEASGAPPTPPPGGDSAAPTLSAMEWSGLDRVVDRAIEESPGWRSLSIRLPLSEDGKASVAVDRSARRGRPDLRTQLVVDRRSGQLTQRALFADESLGRRARSWMRWIHTGEAGGLYGQTVAALACSAVLVLGWTGFGLAWRRFSAWRRREALEGASRESARLSTARLEPTND